MALKVGDRVKVVTREVNAEDAKTGLYFVYFGGLTGAVDTVFDDDSICVNVDLDSLTEAARDRHLALQEAERQKWIDSLSAEARSRLTPEQQQLKMSYKILVGKNDLEPIKGGEPSAKPKPPAASATAKPASEAKDSKPADGKQSSAKAEPEDDVEEPPPQRLSEADLAAKEEEFLRSLKQSD